MMATRLFVGNLPDKVNENELRSTFSAFGEITALDIKSKPGVDNDKKLFAFVTLSASNYDIESCIKYFTNGDFYGNQLYVTRARESFLERLQREREQAQRKEIEKNEPLKTNPTPVPLKIKLNAHKRKYEACSVMQENGYEKKNKKKYEKNHKPVIDELKTENNLHNKSNAGDGIKNSEDQQKVDSDKKRLESMKKKRKDFNEKKMIIKTGLTGIDKAPNKKVVFSDNEEIMSNNFPSAKNYEHCMSETKKKTELFDADDDSDSEVNFNIKKQFEGKKGQKVLDLQSRYKADKRFVLDERFIEGDKSDDETNKLEDKGEDVELGQTDEKLKQLNILQDVLGVPIKIKQSQDPVKQTKSKLGMLRFDPTQPNHAKFLAPVAAKEVQSKKSKKKKCDETVEEIFQEERKEIKKVEVSKEQFYKVSDTLKEAMTQPNSFSLRSMFCPDITDADKNETLYENNEHKLSKGHKEKKVKNPLDPGKQNPFLYDSSESENEEEIKDIKEESKIVEPKPVWREKLFFSESDERLKDGILFFTKSNVEKAHKDRRELKSIMKKRVYNKERKNQMFQKKIGGRRKNMKKYFGKKH